MVINVKLSDSLTNDLVLKAANLKVTMDDLVERLVRHALKSEQIDLLVSNSDVTKDLREDYEDEFIEFPTLSEIVAEIQSLPPSQPTRIPTDKSLAEILDELENRPIPDDEPSPEEWNRIWQKFEIEQKKLDLANDIVEQNI